MTDVFDKKTRSKNMSLIRGKDTKPELLIRKELHKRGFRYRLHRANLPGKPDIVLAKYSAVIEVHGCFWHGHDCHLFHWPKTRRDFWSLKINENIKRDEKNHKKLLETGWRVLIVWECALKGSTRLDKIECMQLIADWLIKGKNSHESAWEGIENICQITGSRT